MNIGRGIKLKLFTVFLLSYIIIGTTYSVDVFAQEETITIPDETFTIPDEILTIPDEILNQDLSYLYQPTVETITVLGTSFADGFIKFIGLLITVIIGVGIGKLISKIISKLIKKVFTNEKLLKSMGMTTKEYEDSSWFKVHELIPFTARWFIYITAFVIGFGFLNIPDASNLMAEFSAWMPRIIIFLASIVVGFVMVKVALKWITDIKPEIFGDEISSKVIKAIISVIIYAFIFGIGITTLGIGEQIIPIFYWVIPAGIMGILIAIAVGARKTAMYLVTSESIKRQGIIGAKVKFMVGKNEMKGIISDAGIAHFKFTTDDEKVTIHPIDMLQSTSFTILEKAPEKTTAKSS